MRESDCWAGRSHVAWLQRHQPRRLVAAKVQFAGLLFAIFVDHHLLGRRVAVVDFELVA